MSKFRNSLFATIMIAGAVAASSSALAQQKMAPVKKFALGREATAEEIKGWDIDVRPDGVGLPVGKGTAKQGEPIYIEKCASCHGEFGESAGRWPILSGGNGTLKSHDPVKSIGSYWPYVTTLFDYILHAMPYGNAQSLTPDEIYAVSAYILLLNDIIKDENQELNEKNFAKIRLPNEANFFDDDREKSEKHFWKKNPCMSNCMKGEAKVTGRAAVIDVTPEGGKGPKVD